jgi:hypothetical protein
MSIKHHVKLSLATENVAKKSQLLFGYYQGLFLFHDKKFVKYRTFVCICIPSIHISLTYIYRMVMVEQWKS